VEHIIPFKDASSRSNVQLGIVVRRLFYEEWIWKIVQNNNKEAENYDDGFFIQKKRSVKDGEGTLQPPTFDVGKKWQKGNVNLEIFTLH
jgi:hypothetical protein